MPVARWPALDGLGVDAIVTTRAAGNLGLHVGDDAERVRANRGRAAEALGAAPGDLVFCRQSHGAGVAVVGRGHRGRGLTDDEDAIPATDALVTAEPGPVLVVMVADCVPLVLVDPVRRVLACVHAGWGGTVRGVTGAAVAAMRDLGADPAAIVAAIGPSIAPGRYQVGDDVAEAAADAFGARTGEVVRPDGTGRWLFDLWRATALQLVEAGVPDRSIHLAGEDTGPGTPWFSHRSEGPCGRFALLATLSGAGPP